MRGSSGLQINLILALSSLVLSHYTLKSNNLLKHPFVAFAIKNVKLKEIVLRFRQKAFPVNFIPFCNPRKT